MQSMLQQLSELDLISKAKAVLTFLDRVDPCFLGLIVTALVLLGSRMISGENKIRGWGLRIALGTFLLFGGYKCYQAGITGYSKQALDIGLRSVCVAGGVLAFTWIVVPIASFILKHARIALAAFLLYGGWLAITKTDQWEQRWPWFMAQALVAAGLALLVAWITEPFWSYFVKNWLPVRKPERIRGATLIDEPFESAMGQEVVVPLNLEPRPTRRRATMLASPRELLPETSEAEMEALRHREAQRRREKVRLQLELAYVQAAPKISSWFSRQMFDDFVQRYLNDNLPPEDVEENGIQLHATIQKHLEESQQPPEIQTMEDLTDWLLAEQQRIQGQSMDASQKNGQLLDLHQRYLALASRLVQPGMPALPRSNSLG